MFLKKNYIIIFIIAFGCLLIANNVFAADYKIEIPLPGLPADSSVADPGAYVKYLFIFGLSLAGFLAVGAIAVGGVKYMLAGASIGNVQQAKDLISGALMGLGLLLASYLLLTTIDPTLTNLSPEPLTAINIEPPSPPDNGLTEGSITAQGAQGTGEIKCKTTSICQSIQNGQVNNTLIKDITSLPVNVTITETTGNHGCFAGDNCVGGAACGTSTHCSGRAADIRISNLDNAQRQQVLQTLSQNRCVNELFYAGFPQYCRADGGQNASKSRSCASHTDHIHYSVKPNCG